MLGGAACEPPIPSSYPGPVSVEVGSTNDEFMTLVDGEKITINHGAQGGFHVWGALRAFNLDPRELRGRFTIAFDDGSAPLAVRDDVFDLEGTSVGITPGTHVGTTVFLPDPQQVAGKACRLSITVTDREGRTGSDSRRVVPTNP